jgi:hypothetical protein
MRKKMPKKKTPDTMEELNAARGFVGGKKRGRKGCLLTLLAGSILLLVSLYGLILYRQRMLDLEAVAYLRAVQTATARADQSADEPAEAAPLSQPEPTEGEAPALTATMGAELTSVVEFFQTLTPEP